MTSSLFDTHCHLDDPRFRDDLDTVLERAQRAGVGRITTVGCARSVETVESALAIARAHSKWVTATVGVHPHDAKDLTPTLLDAMEQAAADPLVIAIGETGLDYHYDHSPRATQAEAFRAQIALAKRLDRPLVIHTRSAPADTLRILEEEGARDVGGVIHCFSEDAAFAKAALDLNFASSFSGIVSFKNATSVREAARILPADAFLVETDAPYLAPIPHRGKRNEPSYVADTLTAVATLRGISREAAIHLSTENACRIFKLAMPTTSSGKSA